MWQFQRNPPKKLSELSALNGAHFKPLNVFSFSCAVSNESVGNADGSPHVVRLKRKVRRHQSMASVASTSSSGSVSVATSTVASAATMTMDSPVVASSRSSREAKRAQRKSMAAAPVSRAKHDFGGTNYEKIPSLHDDDDAAAADDDDNDNAPLAPDENDKNDANGDDSDIVSPRINGAATLDMMPVAAPARQRGVKGMLSRAKAKFTSRSSNTRALASSTLFASSEANAVEPSLSAEQRRALEVAHFRAAHKVPRVAAESEADTCNAPAAISAVDIAAAVAAPEEEDVEHVPIPIIVAKNKSLDQQVDELIQSMPLDWHLFEKRELFQLALSVAVRCNERAEHLAFIRDALEKKRVAHALADDKKREAAPDAPVKRPAAAAAVASTSLARHNSEVVSSGRKHGRSHHRAHESSQPLSAAASSSAAAPLPRAERVVSRPTIADLARAGNNVLPLLWLPGDVRARIARLIGYPLRATIAQLSKSNLMLSRHYETRLRAPTDCSSAENFDAYRQLVNESRAIVALSIWPVPDFMLSLLCTRAAQQNCLRTLSIHDGDSASAMYVGLNDLAKLTTLERVEVRDLFDGVVLTQLHLPRSVRHLALLGRAGRARAAHGYTAPLLMPHRSLHLARVLADVAPQLETLRVRHLAGVPAEVGSRTDESTCAALSHAAVARFARLRDVDSDMWPLAWLAVVGAARPALRRATEALGTALRMRPPLLNAVVTVEREPCYWGGQSRDECDVVLGRAPIGGYLVRYSDRSVQLVVSYNDVAQRRPRHVLVDVDDRGVCWETDRSSAFGSVKQLLAFYPDTYLVAISHDDAGGGDDDDTEEAWDEFIGDANADDVDPNFWL